MSTYLQSSMLTLLGMPADVRAALSDDQAGVAAEYLRLMHPVTRRTAGIFNERRHLTILDRDVFRLEDIHAPTLVIHGTADSLQPFSHGRFAAGHIPGAQLVALEGAGHLPVRHLGEIRGHTGRFLAEVTS